MRTNTTPNRLTDVDLTALTEHAVRHAEALPSGVLAVATSKQLASVAKMLDAGGFHADARELRRYVHVACGGSR